MRTLGVTADPVANGRDAIAALKAQARQFSDANLPRAASAAESAGKVVSDFALSASKSVAQSLRARNRSIASRSLLASAGRFVARNPLIIAAAGGAVAAIAYAAWRAQQDETPAE